MIRSNQIAIDLFNHSFHIMSQTTDGNKCCCCGPYPQIDLSPIFKSRKYCSKEISKQREVVQKQLKEACDQYGCFHVTIDTDSLLLESDQTLSMLGDIKNVKDLIESLFERDFLRTIQQSYNEANHYNSNKPMSNSVQVPFIGKDNNGNENIVLSATYRGRCAESGSKKSNVDEGEPKQSWEIFRSSQQNDMFQDNKLFPNTEKLALLQQFVHNLHKVAVVLCLEAFNLPLGSFVCGEENFNPSKDLLRVFRYDALSSDEEQLLNLGSSIHTDWGSLTVVWQDDVGGLQIFCHKCDKWNNVEARGGVWDENKSIRLFIHVGDFMSLAVNSWYYKSTDEIKISEQTVRWPSPTHRVICPVRRSGSSHHSRCSLVYFAYPPNGISLSDAIRSLSEQNESTKTECRTKDKINCTSNTTFPFKRYMLLNDQSVDNGNTSHMEQNEISKNMFERILYQPIDEVIEQKWNQVQRS